MQKARRHPDKSRLRPLVSVWFQDLFHSSVRGAFHLSLTVLVHYRSLRSIQPYQMVLADSHRISRVPCYSGYHQNFIFFHVRDYHPLWFSFPENSISKIKFILWSYNPINAETFMVWAIPRSIATTRRITIVFFSSGYLDVSVLRVHAKLLPAFSRKGYPIRKSTDITVICTSPQLIAAYHVLHRL